MEDKKKICPYCGEKMNEEFKFCPYCGGGDSAVASFAFAIVSGVLAAIFAMIILGNMALSFFYLSGWFEFVFVSVTIACGIAAAIFGAIELKKTKKVCLAVLNYRSNCGIVHVNIFSLRYCCGSAGGINNLSSMGNLSVGKAT